MLALILSMLVGQVLDPVSVRHLASVDSACRFDSYSSSVSGFAYYVGEDPYGSALGLFTTWCDHVGSGLASWWDLACTSTCEGYSDDYDCPVDSEWLEYMSGTALYEPSGCLALTFVPGWYLAQPSFSPYGMEGCDSFSWDCGSGAECYTSDTAVDIEVVPLSGLGDVFCSDDCGTIASTCPGILNRVAGWSGSTQVAVRAFERWALVVMCYEWSDGVFRPVQTDGSAFVYVLGAEGGTVPSVSASPCPAADVCFSDCLYYYSVQRDQTNDICDTALAYSGFYYATFDLDFGSVQGTSLDSWSELMREHAETQALVSMALDGGSDPVLDPLSAEWGEYDENSHPWTGATLSLEGAMDVVRDAALSHPTIGAVDTAVDRLEYPLSQYAGPGPGEGLDLEIVVPGSTWSWLPEAARFDWSLDFNEVATHFQGSWWWTWFRSFNTFVMLFYYFFWNIRVWLWALAASDWPNPWQMARLGVG